MSHITEDFRRAALRNGVIVRSKARTADTHLVHAAVLEMANHGYRVVPEKLDGMSVAALTAMLSDARAIVGADRDMTPIYPGFPKQVRDLDTLTLLVEQILHYWTGGEFLPNHPHIVREGLPLIDIARNVRDVDVLDAGSGATRFIGELTRRGVALSDTDRALLSGSVAVARPSVDQVRAVIRGASNGENIQALIGALLEAKVLGADEAVIAFADDMRTSDQLLRLVLVATATPSPKDQTRGERAIFALADSGASAVRMSSLSRPARRAVMAALGRLTEGFYADRLVMRRRLWRSVMRSIHPYSQIALDDAARRAADIISSNIEWRTLDSRVEDALRDNDAPEAADLLAEHRPGALLMRTTALLRAIGSRSAARHVAAKVREVSATAPVTSLVKAYNDAVSVNFGGVKVVREAGSANRMVDRAYAEVPAERVNEVVAAITDSLIARLAQCDAPNAPVGITGDMAVPLVRRDASATDRVLDRGERMAPVGQGDVLRVFSHWTNNSDRSGFLDLGVAVLDAQFAHLTTSTWDTWKDNRAWSTYSGDKQVRPRDSAVEFFDVDIAALRKEWPSAKWAVMTVQSWSGIPLDRVDMVAGTMLRTDADKGAVFDPRTVTSAFSPTTSALQALPLAVDLETGEMVWLDASSGSKAQGVSAAHDEAVGPVVRDALARPRMCVGELALLWAQAHGAEITDAPVDRAAVLALLD